MHFLLEEMCKVIRPCQPRAQVSVVANMPSEPAGLHLRTPEVISTQLGNTMGNVRKNICLECLVADLELLEILVSGKIVNMGMTIRQVYEYVHWPAL